MSTFVTYWANHHDWSDISEEESEDGHARVIIITDPDPNEEVDDSSEYWSSEY